MLLNSILQDESKKQLPEMRWETLSIYLSIYHIFNTFLNLGLASISACEGRGRKNKCPFMLFNQSFFSPLILTHPVHLHFPNLHKDATYTLRPLLCVFSAACTWSTQPHPVLKSTLLFADFHISYTRIMTPFFQPSDTFPLLNGLLHNPCNRAPIYNHISKFI